jgi:hypothetical protein
MGATTQSNPRSDIIWTPEELHKEALKLASEMVERAEGSRQAEDFDTGLPFKSKYIRALAYLQRVDAAEYNRAWTAIKKAKPAPDLTLLKSKINAEVKIQDANEKVASSCRANLSEDPNYALPTILMENIDGYIINSNGGLSKIVLEPALGKTEETIAVKEVPICDFVAWPRREILKDDGMSKERFIELEGTLPDYTGLPKVAIPMSEFGEMRWPGIHWGMQAAIRPYKQMELKYCLQKMAQGGISESRVYTFLGWKKVDGKWIYLHAGGAVGAENVEIELPEKLRNYRLPKRTPDLRQAIKAVTDLFEIGPGKILYPLVSVAFLSPLMEPFRQAGIEPGVVIYLWGHTGSRKSTLIALVLCLFGKFDNKSLPASFRDTAKNIEVLAFIVKDNLLVVDDLYPTNNPKEFKELVGKLEYLLRNQGDRQGRGRLTKSDKGNYVPGGGKDPRGMVVASGEMQPLSGSSLARAYTIHINPGDINNEKLKESQDQSELLGHAMVGYLEWLAPKLDDLPKTLASKFNELRKKAREEAKVKGRHGRLDEAIAHMYIGLEMFFKYAVESGAVTEELANVHLDKAWEVLKQGADEQTEMAHANDTTELFIKAILDLLAQNKVYFASMDGKVPVMDQEIIPLKRELIGWGPDGNGVYYILMKPAVKTVNELLRGQGESIVITTDTLLDALEQKDLLATPPGKTRSYPKTIKRKTYWVTAVKSQAFDLKEDEQAET